MPYNNKEMERSVEKHRGIVKMVISGDTILIRATKGAPPQEKTISLVSITSPKLGRRPTAANDFQTTNDEPWGWDAREFLRKKLVGNEVIFDYERPPNSTRAYGHVWLVRKNTEGNENIIETLVKEGLAVVRRESRATSELKHLIELEEKAKAAHHGKWSRVPLFKKIRKVIWNIENPLTIVEHFRGQLVDAIIEHVRDGSTLRCFLLPDFYYISVMLAGIRCPTYKIAEGGKRISDVVVPFADEARFFVESRLLQRDIKLRLETVNNFNFIGTIYYPKGNIAEALLLEGLAKTVDWSLAVMKDGIDELLHAEGMARVKRLRLWKDEPLKPLYSSDIAYDFYGTVVEVINGEGLNVKLSNGDIKKVFFSSTRAPRDTLGTLGVSYEDIIRGTVPRPKNFRPLYDIPFLFEAREFLRKLLVGKEVRCILDYISPAREIFPEKYSYTVYCESGNVAEQLINMGLATVVRYRPDDDQRSHAYDQLVAAESMAVKAKNGMHKYNKNTVIRVNDLTLDHSRIKTQYLPSWQRSKTTEAIVEFVACGTRMRIYIPKDSCLVSFSLSGVTCPRIARPASNGLEALFGEPYGDEAFEFTRDHVLQRNVFVHIHGLDKAGTSVLGWLWTENGMNLSFALVENGLAEIHYKADKSEFYFQLKEAENRAKTSRRNLWADYREESLPPADEREELISPPIRKLHFEDVLVTDVTSDLNFYAQSFENTGRVKALMDSLYTFLEAKLSVPGDVVPKRGELCAAQYSGDNKWYRAKIERVFGDTALVKYIDYGNSEIVKVNQLAKLPPTIAYEQPYAIEYELALVELPPDNDDKQYALRSFSEDVLNRRMKLNIESETLDGPRVATLYDPDSKADIGMQLVADGLVLIKQKFDRKMHELYGEYMKKQNLALRNHLGIWKYGDIREEPDIATANTCNNY